MKNETKIKPSVNSQAAHLFYFFQGRILLNKSMSCAEATPNVAIHSIGSNFYDPDEQVLHLIVGGSRGIEIRAISYLKLTMDVDAALLLDEFYAENLREKLASYLGVSSREVFDNFYGLFLKQKSHTQRGKW